MRCIVLKVRGEKLEVREAGKTFGIEWSRVLRRVKGVVCMDCGIVGMEKGGC